MDMVGSDLEAAQSSRAAGSRLLTSTVFMSRSNLFLRRIPVRNFQAAQVHQIVFSRRHVPDKPVYVMLDGGFPALTTGDILECGSCKHPVVALDPFSERTLEVGDCSFRSRAGNFSRTISIR
jgi:hypothetical protein